MRPAVVALTVVAGAGLAACGGHPVVSSAPPNWLSQVQPFVNRPAPAYTPRVFAPAPYPTNAPLCPASQLHAVGGPDGVGLGNSLYQVNFTNVSQAPCQLSGAPQVQGVDASGRLVTVTPTAGVTYFTDPIPADIAPGEAGYLNIGMASEGNCPGAPAPVTFRKLRFGLPGGGWISTEISVTKACGILDISGLGKKPGPVVEPSPRPGTPASLQATADILPQARAGSTLRFTVTLANASNVAVDLSPCPTYTLFGGPSPRSLYLNCDHVTSIPAGARVVYAIEVHIPADARPGASKVGWA